MIIFEKDRLTIVITGDHVAEVWTETVQELLDLLYCKGDDFAGSHRNVLFLLQELMPDRNQAGAMSGILPETEK